MCPDGEMGFARLDLTKRFDELIDELKRRPCGDLTLGNPLCCQFGELKILLLPDWFDVRVHLNPPTMRSSVFVTPMLANGEKIKAGDGNSSPTAYIHHFKMKSSISCTFNEK